MIDSSKNNFLINAEVDKYLENSLKTSSLSNGYIFYGPEGVGKKQTAFKFIKGILKQHSLNKNIENKISINNHPDLFLIKPKDLNKVQISKNAEKEYSENNNLEIIKIEQVRKIKVFLSQKSMDSEKKIVFIDNAHLLNESASNCLLKTLEEPNNGIFILITPRLNLLLDTIRSRCQLVKFKSFSKDQIEIFLQNNLDSEISSINKNLNFQDLVNLANGSPGKLLSKIQILNEISDEILEKLESPLKEEIEILDISKLISEQLEVFKQISLIEYLQYIWWRKTKNKNIIKNLEKLKSHLKNYIQPRLAWEVILIKINLDL